MLSAGKHIGIEEVIEEVRRERGKQRSHFFDNESIIGMVATKKENQRRERKEIELEVELLLWKCQCREGQKQLLSFEL